MMKITGLSHLFKWENLHNWWLTKYFFAPLYMLLLFFRKIIYHIPMPMTLNFIFLLKAITVLCLECLQHIINAGWT